MLVSDFHYDLPPESIAQEPLSNRSASRLLHLLRKNEAWQDRAFRDFPGLLHPDDLLVLNNTRVFPARLYGHRSGERAQPLSPKNPASRDFLRGRVEVLLTRQISEDPNEWESLVRPGRKIGIGERLYFSDPHAKAESALEAEITARGAYGERRVRFRSVPDFFSRIERLGHVPLPPYIAREDHPTDRDRYQKEESIDLHGRFRAYRVMSLSGSDASSTITPHSANSFANRRANAVPMVSPGR